MPSFLDKDGFQYFVDNRIGHADYTGLGATITEALMNSGGSRVGIHITRTPGIIITDELYIVTQGSYTVSAPIKNGETYIECSGFRDSSPIKVIINYTINGEATSVEETVIPTTYSKYDVYLTLGKLGLDVGELLSLARWTGTQYDDMEQVLADEKCIRQIMTVHDSVDYIAESLTNDPEAATEFFNNDLIAKWVNLRDYALDKFEADENIKSVLDEVDKYGYGEWALLPQVPTMTSNTAPYGEAFGSSVYSSSTGTYDYYKAFDGKEDGTGLYWCSKNGQQINSYIGYDFINPVIINEVRLVNYKNTSELVRTFIIEASNDGSEYEPISDEITNEAGLSEGKSYKINNKTAYRYYRIKNLTCSGSYATWQEIQFYAWGLKGNVPVMTSNTAPYGEAIAFINSSSGGAAYYVFKDSPQLVDAYYGGNGNITTQYIGYKFPNPINVKMFKHKWVTSGGRTLSSMELQYSNDGTNWISLETYNNVGSSQEIRYYKSSNDVYALYWRIHYLTSSNGRSVHYHETQFYGRQLNVSIPVMTSNTAPYGEASASSVHTNRPAYQAFNGVAYNGSGATTYWLPATGGEQYLEYDFGKDICVKGVYINAGENKITSLELKGYENNNPESIAVKTLTNPLKEYIDLNSSHKAYKKYRIIFNMTAQVGIGILQLYGVDYSEREFEPNSNMKYIYDHGVEFIGVALKSGATVLEKLPYALHAKTTATVSAGTGFYAGADLTPYTLERLRGIAVSLGIGTETNVASISAKAVSASELPNNIYMDTKNINAAYMMHCYLTTVNEVFVEEWWLE